MDHDGPLLCITSSGPHPPAPQHLGTLMVAPGLALALPQPASRFTKDGRRTILSS